jgi:ribulose-5-phosphate 4-epimerase/fuculose-1-phosphate aldolase
LMRGHGDVLVGPSLHVAVARSYYTIVNARLQLEAMQLGGSPTYLNEAESRKALPPDNYERAWSFWKKKLKTK